MCRKALKECERTTFEGQRTHPIKNIENGNHTKCEHFCYKENGRKMYRQRRKEEVEWKRRKEVASGKKWHPECISKQKRKRERDRKKRAVRRKTFLSLKNNEREPLSVRKGGSIWIFSQVNQGKWKVKFQRERKGGRERKREESSTKSLRNPVQILLHLKSVQKRFLWTEKEWDRRMKVSNWKNVYRKEFETRIELNWIEL